jgi:hypothetical protein
MFCIVCVCARWRVTLHHYTRAHIHTRIVCVCARWRVALHQCSGVSDIKVKPQDFQNAISIVYSAGLTTRPDMQPTHIRRGGFSSYSMMLYIHSVVSRIRILLLRNLMSQHAHQCTSVYMPRMCCRNQRFIHERMPTALNQGSKHTILVD